MRRSYWRFHSHRPPRWALAAPLVCVLSLSCLGCSEPNKPAEIPSTATNGTRSPGETIRLDRAGKPKQTLSTADRRSPEEESQAALQAPCVADEGLAHRLKGTVALPDGMQRADGDTEFFLEGGTYKLQTFNRQRNGRYRVCRALVCTRVTGADEICRTLEIGQGGWGRLDSQRFLFKKIERS